jgi:hypothetical protein
MPDPTFSHAPACFHVCRATYCWGSSTASMQCCLLRPALLLAMHHGAACVPATAAGTPGGAATYTPRTTLLVLAGQLSHEHHVTGCTHQRRRTALRCGSVAAAQELQRPSLCRVMIFYPSGPNRQTLGRCDVQSSSAASRARGARRAGDRWPKIGSPVAHLPSTAIVKKRACRHAHMLCIALITMSES